MNDYFEIRKAYMKHDSITERAKKEQRKEQRFLKQDPVKRFMQASNNRLDQINKKDNEQKERNKKAEDVITAIDKQISALENQVIEINAKINRLRQTRKHWESTIKKTTLS